MTSWNDLVARILATEPAGNRLLIAVAGPPGSGKSHISERLRAALSPEQAEILPMDGFHYDNLVLDQLQLRHRKGAPQTFDFENFELTLRRVRDSESAVAVPVFDRLLDLSRAGARLIGSATRYVIVEGNYLLLDRQPWAGLAPLFDLTIFLETPRERLESRLLKRWTDLDYSRHDAEVKVRGNDMPNVDLVLNHSLQPDVVLGSSVQAGKYR